MATAISIFNDYANAEESNRRVLAWIERSPAPLITGPAIAVAGPVIVHTLAQHTASEQVTAHRVKGWPLGSARARVWPDRKFDRT